MVSILISINGIKSTGDPSSYGVKRSDSLDTSDLVSGTVVMDGGRDKESDIYNFTAAFRESDFATIENWADVRTPVTIIDHRGFNLGQKILKITDWKYIEGAELRELTISVLPNRIINIRNALGG